MHASRDTVRYVDSSTKIASVFNVSEVDLFRRMSVCMSKWLQTDTPVPSVCNHFEISSMPAAYVLLIALDVAFIDVIMCTNHRNDA